MYGTDLCRLAGHYVAFHRHSYALPQLQAPPAAGPPPFSPGLTRKLKQVKAVGLLSLAMAGFVLLTFLLTCVTRVSDLSLLCLPILGTYCVVLAVVMRRFSRLF